MRSRPSRTRRTTAVVLLALAGAGGCGAQDLPEYRLKAAYVYNFLGYTEWPADTGPTLTLCISGSDPFGSEIDTLHGRQAAGRQIAVQRRAQGEALKSCHAVFVTASAMDNLNRLLDGLRGTPVLTLADQPGAARRGVMLNLHVAQGKVTFEANLQAARHANVSLSSKLLRLATEVIQ